MKQIYQQLRGPVSMRRYTEDRQLSLVPLVKHFVARVARSVRYLSADADIVLYNLLAFPTGGIVRLSILPKLVVEMLPEYDPGHFFILPRMGSLNRIDGDFHVDEISAVNAAAFIPATSRFNLTVETEADALVVWLEKPFVAQCLAALNLSHLEIDTIQTDLHESTLVSTIASWEALAAGRVGSPDTPLDFPSLLGFYLANLYSRRAPPSPEVSDVRLFLRFEAYVKANIPKRVTIQDVCCVLDCSTKDLIDQTRLHSGLTPARYIMRERVRSLCAQLLSTGTPLCELAYAHGFSSQAHMTTAFREHTGMTPGQYRRRTIGTDGDD